MKKGFTLLELVVVIIILGVLATLGITQYANIVEKSRLAEAIDSIRVMRELAYKYYVEHSSLDGITDNDVGVDATCTSTGFYRFLISYKTSTGLNLCADRCTSNGKTPNASRRYLYFLWFSPGTGQSDWHCRYSDDSSSCFGLPP